MKKIVIACILSLSIGTIATAQMFSGGFFTNFRWNSMNYGQGWKLVGTEIHQATGRVFMFWQNAATGEVAVHMYTDTGVVTCHDLASGFPSVCTSGMVIN